jgi:hypothetical protein
MIEDMAENRLIYIYKIVDGLFLNDNLKILLNDIFNC